MPEETVDVVIVGAGAAGAAIAWSLAETRMRIVCLEQGGWMDPSEYPSTRSDWELQGLGPFLFFLILAVAFAGAQIQERMRRLSAAS